MKVSELREVLTAFRDQDAQVVIGLDPREWVKPLGAWPAEVDLGRVKERSLFIQVVELPAEEPDGCPRCDRLMGAIEDAKSALDGAD